MKANAYISREAAYYFRGVDLSAVVNDMMESMDCAYLPTPGRPAEVHLRVEVDHPDYINAVRNGQTRGRGAQYSISRILEYAYDVDYLTSHQIETPDDDEETQQIMKIATIRSCAKKLANFGTDEILTTIVQTLNAYVEQLKGEQE